MSGNPPLTIRRKLILSALTAFALFGALEIVADLLVISRDAFFSPTPATSQRERPALINRQQPLRYEFRPDTQHREGGGASSVNSLGLRGGEIEQPKTKLRVLCIGDSVTHGYAPDVTNDKTYPAQLNEWLDGRFPGRFEVVNAGMPNFGTLDSLNFLIVRGAELQPDFIIFLGGWNDCHHMHGLQRHFPESAKTKSPLRSLSLYRIGRAISTRVASSRRTNPTDDRSLETLPSPTDDLSEAAFEKSGRILSHIVRASRSMGAEPILVGLPHFSNDDWKGSDSLSDAERQIMTHHLTHWNLSPGGWHTFVTRMNGIMADVCKTNGTTCVSTSTIDQPESFVDVCHLNAKGNRALAAAVGPAIVKRATALKLLESDKSD